MGKSIGAGPAGHVSGHVKVRDHGTKSDFVSGSDFGLHAGLDPFTVDEGPVGSANLLIDEEAGPFTDQFGVTPADRTLCVDG